MKLSDIMEIATSNITIKDSHGRIIVNDADYIPPFKATTPEDAKNILEKGLLTIRKDANQIYYALHYDNKPWNAYF